MLKYPIPETHLNNKLATITVTNVCTNNCGGCNQLCGKFDKTWFISPTTFEKSIKSLIEYSKENWVRPDFPSINKFFCIFGGEPTIHPDWETLLKIMQTYEEYPFVIYTNGYSFKNLQSLQFQNLVVEI
jgi:organic radical activating enzyme